MTGIFALDWAVMAASLFNTVILLWLGLTVLLNAERRNWGVWATGGGILTGAAFFVSHTIILAQQLEDSLRDLNFWWQVGWVPVVVAPFAWYVVMLWYAGYWNGGHNRLRRRHQLWLLATCGLLLGLSGLMVFANPLPSFAQVAILDLSAPQAIDGISLLLVVYPAFIVLCILLSIDALRHPEPPERVMGNLARQRARPWLTGAAMVLLLVSILVTWFMTWAVRNARAHSPELFGGRIVQAVALFDFVVASLVALAVILIGQAIVSYEVFTGKILPRRGFLRHWRSAVILAGGYSVLVGWSLASHLRPTYSLLLTTALMVAFYALFSWRSFVHRERFMASLRPFVSSQSLTSHLVGADNGSRRRADVIFEALCEDVISARQAQLTALGALAPLAGEPLLYSSARSDLRPVHIDGSLFTNAEASLTPLEPQTHDGYQWAIQLWTERGLIGALMLGPKQDGGLYTQEEFEIARASGERIVDMLAGEEMARRLMAFQRKRLAETQVLDRRIQRALHDEVLPDIHAAVLELSQPPDVSTSVQSAIQTLTHAHGRIADLIHTMPGISANVMDSDLLAPLKEMVRVEFTDHFEEVSWHGADSVPRLKPMVQEVVFFAVREAVRNAALHGRGEKEAHTLRLEIEFTRAHELAVAIRDNGVGLGQRAESRPERDGELQLGSQSGLALHSTMLAVIGGRLSVRSRNGGGTEVIITAPLE